MSKWKTPFEICGAECDDGWAKLYQPLLDLLALYGGTPFQVKEKFGGLRFYYDGIKDPEKDKGMEALVRAAESASYHTCERCGEDGVEGWEPETRRPIYKANPGGKGWIKTLCAPCRELKS